MKKYFILAAAAAMFAACSNTDDIAQTSDVQGERIPLTIGAAYANATMRGTSTTFQSIALDASNTIGIYIRKNGSVAAKVTTDTYEVDNILSSTLTPVTRNSTDYSDVNTTSTLYYPDGKEKKIDIYAYAPSSIMSTAATTIGEFDIDLSAKMNQNADADYMANDILWGMEGSTNEISAKQYATVDRTDGTVTGAYVGTGSGANVIIPMSHKGSKIVVTLSPSGMDASKLDGATIKFMVDYTKGKMNLSNGEITTYTAAGTYYAVSQGITLTTGLDNTTHACAAVILPQPINARSMDNTIPNNPDNGNQNYRLIEITLTDGSKYVYVVNTVQTFESGKVYNYNITVTASGLNITTTVAPWIDGTSSLSDSGNGSATLE